MSLPCFEMPNLYLRRRRLPEPPPGDRRRSGLGGPSFRGLGSSLDRRLSSSEKSGE